MGPGQAQGQEAVGAIQRSRYRIEAGAPHPKLGIRGIARRLDSRRHMNVLALNCGSSRRHVGADLAPLRGVDAVVFSGGIGEHAPEVRTRICARMTWCGLRLDPDRNASTAGTACARTFAMRAKRFADPTRW